MKTRRSCPEVCRQRASFCSCWGRKGEVTERGGVFGEALPAAPEIVTTRGAERGGILGKETPFVLAMGKASQPSSLHNGM